MQIDMSAAVQGIYKRGSQDSGQVHLPPDLDAIAKGGFIITAGRLYLAAPTHNSLPPADFDDWEAERWVNKVYLDATTPAGHPQWRGELLRNGLELARWLLVEARKLTDLPVQAVVSLQSAEGEADPDIDYATGALHIYLLRSPRDDMGPSVAGSSQPTLVLTSGS